METSAQVKSNLKQLRLSTFIDNLDIRIEEAIKTKMSYQDFLLILTQDEVDLRRQKRKEVRIKKACLGNYKNIVEFDFDFNPKISRQMIMKLCSCDFINKHENIIFAGPTGIGKTFLAKAIGYEACCKGFKVLFTRTAKMLEHIYSGKADNSFQKKLDVYIKPDLLILDDWGMQPFKECMLNILNEIISERYETGSMIITSNRPIQNWDELFNEPVVSSALLDRLFHNTYKIIIDTDSKSYRRRSK
jgi:DNA replication protein DnaC